MALELLVNVSRITPLICFRFFFRFFRMAFMNRQLHGHLQTEIKTLYIYNVILDSDKDLCENHSEVE